MWYDTFNDIFWISISTSFFALVGLTIKTALKSKCDETNLCWGLIKIHRRCELENLENSEEESVKKVTVV